MAGLFFPATPAPKPASSTASALGGSKSPYPDDNATRMPVSNSAATLEAARQRRASIIARSGRTSTQLVSDAGVKPYVNSYLGGS
jgi:hypothetical protein